MKHEYIQANGIRMHYVTEGKGPPVVLLHGFPENWYAWRHQIPALAGHFRVIAPDLRGYGDTEKPPKVSDYQIGTIAADIASVIKALGYEKAHIVGHDWGGAVAWNMAIEYPQIVDHVAVLNCPHPSIFAKALKTNHRQMRRSWYIFLFQIPLLPELLFKINSRKMLKRLFRGSAIRKEAFTDEDLEQYYQALRKPGALTSALNYYRAAFRKKEKKDAATPKNAKIAAPVLVIWGEEDAALGKELTEGMDPLFSGPFRIQYLPNCGHWVNEEQPEIVNPLLLEFLSS